MNVLSRLRPGPAASLVALTCAAVLALAGCSAEEEPNTGGDDPQVIEITIEGDSISPTGERVEIPVGEPVIVSVQADRSGSLHVHSTPEQEIAFEDGTTETELTIDQPGVVEVESHDPDLVVLQLEAR